MHVRPTPNIFYMPLKLNFALFCRHTISDNASRNLARGHQENPGSWAEVGAFSGLKLSIIILSPERDAAFPIASECY